MKSISILIIISLLTIVFCACSKEDKGSKEEIRLLKEENNFLKAENIGLKKELEKLYKRLDEYGANEGNNEIILKPETKETEKHKPPKPEQRNMGKTQ